MVQLCLIHLETMLFHRKHGKNSSSAWILKYQIFSIARLAFEEKNDRTLGRQTVFAMLSREQYCLNIYEISEYVEKTVGLKTTLFQGRTTIIWNAMYNEFHNKTKPITNGTYRTKYAVRVMKIVCLCSIQNWGTNDQIYDLIVLVDVAQLHRAECIKTSIRQFSVMKLPDGFESYWRPIVMKLQAKIFPWPFPQNSGELFEFLYPHQIVHTDPDETVTDASQLEKCQSTPESLSDSRLMFYFMISSLKTVALP